MSGLMLFSAILMNWLAGNLHFVPWRTRLDCLSVTFYCLLDCLLVTFYVVIWWYLRLLMYFHCGWFLLEIFFSEKKSKWIISLSPSCFTLFVACKEDICWNARELNVFHKPLVYLTGSGCSILHKHYWVNKIKLFYLSLINNIFLYIN